MEFTLSGKTTLDAKEHFGFPSVNAANVRVWYAFRALGIKRPVFKEIRICGFCGKEYVARRRNCQICGSRECQKAYTDLWRTQNPERTQAFGIRYKRSAKGRAANRKMHRLKRERGQSGTPQQRWAFGLEEIANSFRKRRFLALRGPWTGRLEIIQQTSGLPRESKARPPRNLERRLAKSRSLGAAHFWLNAVGVMQNTHLQQCRVLEMSSWEKAVNNLYNSIVMGNRMRRWKRRASR